MTIEAKPLAIQDRVNLVRTIQTPLGFFVLVVLVVEAILGVIAVSSSVTDRTLLIGGMLTLIFFLVGIVAFMAYFRPEALGGTRPVETVVPEGGKVPAVLQIESPRVLCASTPDFMSVGFERDAAIIRRIFGRRAQIVENLTAGVLQHLLMTKEFDILHILGYVQTTDGTLILNRKDTEEKMSVDGFANLLSVCKAKLVVIATCDSIVLGAHASRQASVVAATTTMRADAFVRWADCFYTLLDQGHALSRAYDIARATTEAPMVLLMKQDFSFVRG